MKDKIKLLLDQFKTNGQNINCIKSYVKKNYRDIYDYVMDYTLFMNDPKCLRYKFRQRLYFVLNGLKDFPICPTCGSKNTRCTDITEYDGYAGIKKYCLKCYRSSKEYIGLNIQRFGVPNVSMLKEIQEKKNQTCLNHYGVTNPSKVKEICDKRSDTILQRFGTRNVNELSEIKEKIRQTSILKFGVDNASKLDEVKRKKERTSISKRGVGYWTQTKFGKQHLSIVNSNNSSERIKKIKETIFRKYGVTHYMKLDKFKKLIVKKRLSKNYDCFLKSDYVIPLFNKDFYIQNYNNDLLQWKCKLCGNVFYSKRLKNGHSCYNHYARCDKCFPLKNLSVSSYEKELFYYIKDFYKDEILCNKRDLINPYEIDLFLPKLNIGIEFNGLYWHSEIYKDSSYHVDKLNMCIDKNIRLINVFEDEWLFNKDIVKSRLKNLLGFYDNVLYSRKCNVKIVTDQEKRLFLNSNHLQGDCISKYNYGLYYNNELVSVMTFGSLRKSLGYTNIEDNYELLRFCNKLNYHIPGAASRLLRHFIDDLQPKRIISYADRRWSVGNVYEKLGFNFVRNTQPNYWYIIDYHREHRFGWRKDVLKDKLKTFDPSISEHKNMILNNIFRIYDCGNKLYQLDLCLNNTNK